MDVFTLKKPNYLHHIYILNHCKHKKYKMEIVKNKWLNIAIVFVMIILAVIVAVSLLTFKTNDKGALKATLNLSGLTGHTSTTAATAATTTTTIK